MSAGATARLRYAPATRRTLALYAQTLTSTEIAERIGLTREAVNAILRRERLRAGRCLMCGQRPVQSTNRCRPCEVAAATAWKERTHQGWRALEAARPSPERLTEMIEQAWKRWEPVQARALAEILTTVHQGEMRV